MIARARTAPSPRIAPAAACCAALLDAEGPHFSASARASRSTCPDAARQMLASLHALIVRDARVAAADPGRGARPVPGRRARGRARRQPDLRRAATRSSASRKSSSACSRRRPRACCRCASGRRAAEDLLFSGRSIDAAEAKALGPRARGRRRSGSALRSHTSTSTSPARAPRRSRCAVRAARGAYLPSCGARLARGRSAVPRQD